MLGTRVFFLILWNSNKKRVLRPRHSLVVDIRRPYITYYNCVLEICLRNFEWPMYPRSFTRVLSFLEKYRRPKVVSHAFCRDLCRRFVLCFLRSVRFLRKSLSFYYANAARRIGRISAKSNDTIMSRRLRHGSVSTDGGTSTTARSKIVTFIIFFLHMRIIL